MNKKNKIIIDTKDTPRIISYETYKMFAKKYGIKLNNRINYDSYSRYIPKSMPMLSQEIYEFENDNNILDGLYFY